jgi:ParB-like chromosome segregation protein Spo0J
MQIEEWDITRVRPYANNPRLNEPAVAAVAASIRAFGFRQPLVVDEDGVLVAGHTRYRAARLLGLPTVPVHVARGLTPAQVKAYRLADNQTATLSQWDDDRLSLELAELQQLDIDLECTGFSADELLRLLEPPTSEGLTDPDAIPEPPDEPDTRPGDLWLLGRHRLLCGDAGDPEALDRLLDGAAVHLVYSDPPGGAWGGARNGNADGAGGGESDRRRPAWLGNLARVLQPGRSFYLWGADNMARSGPVLAAAGLHFSQAIVRVREHPRQTGKDFLSSYAWCGYGWRTGAAHQFLGPADAADVWPARAADPHGTVAGGHQPVALAARALQYSSRPGEHVLDLFGGCGATLVAAEQTDRRAFVLEGDPRSCDVTVRRWQQFTGGQATRAARA